MGGGDRLNTTGALEKKLKKHFNYDSFRKGQREIIEDVLQGKDVLGILPTGSGKSICYQLPALLLPGTVIVVSPLIALMMDQVKQLKAKHFKQVIALNSFLTPIERQQIYQRLHQYRLVYVSPELLQQEQFVFYLKKMNISLFVIDEAHCISQWGHEFRPDYMKLKETIQIIHNPPVLALSATATPMVQQDIMKSLNKPEMNKHIYPIDRKNLIFSIRKVNEHEEKLASIIHLLTIYKLPTLIYFSSRNTAEWMAQTLAYEIPELRVAFYHGGMEPMDRVAIQQQFMNDQLQVICCTSAFGMGIDKSNIRLIIHYHLPTQIESFVQEAGRAGRDGKTSLSILLYSDKDFFIPKQIIQNELPSIEIIQNAFRVLYTLQKESNIFSLTEEQIEQLFQINEIQWRFMHAQFEKHDIIRDNKIIYDKGKWKEAYQQIVDNIQERTRMKESKLHEMLRWIHEENCLREALYQPFQSTFTKPEDYCCSNCGFTVEQWKPDIQTSHHNQPTSWQEKLQQLFLIGDENEAK